MSQQQIDPFIVAECLARPFLSARLINELHAGSNPLTETESLGSSAARTETESSETSEQPNSGYYLLEVASSPVEDPAGGFVEDNWNATTTTGAPAARGRHTAVWTGSEMIVWGGVDNAGDRVKSGGRYNPSTDSWIATTTIGAPDGRSSHTAVWSGTEMIVWGGFDSSSGSLNTGGRYSP
jgi:hypothetical protein